MVGRGPGDWQGPQPRRPGLARLVGGAGVLALVLVLWLNRPPAPVPGLEVTRGGEDRSAGGEDRSAVEDVLPGLAGTWTQGEVAPVSAPGSYAGVWTGDGGTPTTRGELVVVGGGAGGTRRAAAFDPHDGSWRLLPPLPAAAASGSGHVMAWTGREVVVWGTWEPTRMQPRGAAYDPARDRWRELPRAPISDLGPHPVAVWTGSEVLVWGPTLSREVRPSRPEGMAYHPERDTWRTLPPAPLPRVTRANGLWTPHGLVVWGSTTDAVDTTGARRTFAMRFDPAEDRWRRLDDPPLERPARAAVAWSGSQMHFWGPPVADDPAGRPAAATLDLPGGRWETASAPAGAGWPDPVDLTGLRGAWSGSHLLVLGGAGGLPPLAVAGDDPGRWLLLAGWPPGGTAAPVVVWTGDELLVWGGFRQEGSRSVELLRWRARAPGGLPVGAADKEGGDARAGEDTRRARPAG